MKDVSVDVRAFLDAGGCLTLAEWVTLNGTEKEGARTVFREREEARARRVVEIIVEELGDIAERLNLEALHKKAETML